jgi:hypothetical protein
MLKGLLQGCVSGQSLWIGCDRCDRGHILEAATADHLEPPFYSPMTKNVFPPVRIGLALPQKFGPMTIT